MSSGERAGRRAVVMAAWAVLAGLPTGGDHAARAADRTFNVSLVGHLNPLAGTVPSTNNFYADLWSDGDLVVLGSVSTGSTGGVTIIDNASPAAPVRRSRYVPAGTANGQFRDVIVRNGIGYFAIDGGIGGSGTLGGTHIVSLANPASPTLLTVIDGQDGGFVRNHDLFLDGNFLYIADNANNIMKVFDVASPAAPTFVRNITTAGATIDALHDMTIRNGRMYTSNIDNGITQIWDVSNMSATVAPTLLGQLDVGTRNHSTSPSADGNLLAVAREDANGEVQLWNIANPAAPAHITNITAAAYGIDSFSAHNPVMVGDTLYVSWYQAGLQIFNIRNPAAPVHLGAYDTFVGGSGNVGSFAGYDGNWGVDVSGGPSKILLSDFDNGFFTVDASAAFRRVWTYTGGPLWWQDHSRWGNGVGGFPNSSEMTAAFTDPAAGASRTVFIEGGGGVATAVPRVAGIEFLSTLSYTLQPNGGGEIELLASQGLAQITVHDGGAAAAGSNRIVAPIQLNDDLLVTNNARRATPRALELGAIEATNRTVTFAGAGETSLVAPNPQFTGDLVVASGGNLALRDGQATNAQPITVSGGSVSLRHDASTSFQSDLTVTGTATLAVGNGGTGSGQTHALDNITVTAGGSLKLQRENGARLAAGDVSITGTMRIASLAGAGGAVATKFDTLTVAGNGWLDLSDAPLIVASTPPAAVEALVRSGYGEGAWNGKGIITTQPDALTGLTTLAVATAEQVGVASFGGLPVAGDDVLVMYTYGGDTNFDGKLDADDYGTIDFSVLLPGPVEGYYNGDFNYDGVVNADDYGVIDFNILAQDEPFPTSPASLSAVVAVPEPAAAAVAGVVALAVSLRRRRHRAART